MDSKKVKSKNKIFALAGLFGAIILLICTIFIYTSNKTTTKNSNVVTNEVIEITNIAIDDENIPLLEEIIQTKKLDIDLFCITFIILGVMFVEVCKNLIWKKKKSLQKK